ncbi:Clan SC, family S33, methylesterase-like serine peptidase [Tritrichomonas foetus]|uniref:Clan SC, family S33, methylesterase-like serine peptidase n=1 Tax=Tritrichomonas foetus TaxID=1144522 RepID=A0A1J4L617_9EUKA|nr:Clan SC, family S33, methylesterase-like serine peptidase [Tritrichomonas foetus]|eukprot:OHT17389.1 Clan SC, family S33, methylesterase-like serine peptidase [Tritrichomonas foetus]
MSIFLIILLVIALYYLYRFLVSYKAKVFYNPSGNVAPIVSQLKSTNKPYKPTPWLLEGNIHTIMGMRFRAKGSSKCRRDQFTFDDGGTCILDWFEPENATEETPIVGIIHTLAGGTREPCTNNFANAVRRHGWRAVVLNCRGCSGAPITSKRLFNAVQVDDHQKMVDHIYEQFKPKHFFMIGFSLGSMQAINYDLDANSKRLDGLVLVSHVYDTCASAEILEKWPQSKLYLKVIVEKLTHAVKKNQHVDDELKQSIYSKTLCEFDDKFTCKTLGLKDHVEYYEKVQIKDKIARINTPTLIIGSDDDPFTNKKYQPLKEVSESQNVAMVTYPEGGHVSFLTGLNGSKSIVDTIAIEWFDKCLACKKE